MNIAVLITEDKDITEDIELAREYWRKSRGRNERTEYLLKKALKKEINLLIEELDRNDNLSVSDLKEIEEYIREIYK